MESILPQLRCCCCGGPHLNGNCETYSYCDICGKDLVYCSCEPEMILVTGYHPWLAQPKILEEPEMAQLRCCCCGGPHLNGNCETYSYCDICGKDLVYCSCEPEMILVTGYHPWLAQPKILEEPEWIVIDKSYPWLADDWLADEQPLIQNSEQEENGLLIEESWGKNKDGEEKRIEREDPLVWKEAKNSQSWEGVEIQQEITQKSSFPTHLLRSKEYGSEELDRYLDSFYALFIILHLERVWKHMQLYLKFMNFLPHKRKKKDDVFFVSYIPP